jgi:cytochrome c-type biogenesis protein CcmH
MMGEKKMTYKISLTGAILIFFGATGAFSATVDDIAQELTCPCGCNMLVSACEGTMECGPAANIKNEIMAKLNAGMSKEQIIDSFIGRHGEKILSAPTTRGFNLTAWVLPFVAVLFGIGMLYVLLKSWATRERPVHEEVSFKEEDKVYLEKIDKELRTFES